MDLQQQRCELDGRYLRWCDEKLAGIASSADGTKLAAGMDLVATYGPPATAVRTGLYRSYRRLVRRKCGDITSSADGTKLALILKRNRAIGIETGDIQMVVKK